MHLLDLDNLAKSCVKCGKCIPSCTIYQVHRDETTSPRGFLDLLGAYKNKHLPLNNTTRKIFESCFLCTTCVSLCPSSLPTDLAIESVRVDIAKKFGISWYKRAYFFLLRHRNIADFVFCLLGFIAPCFFKVQDGKMRARGFLLGFPKRSIFPFATKSFLQKHGQTHLEPKQDRRVVAIFIGCISNYNYTNVGESLLKILHKLNIKAFVPAHQQCCGAPAFFTGDIDTVLFLIKKNIVYFESFWEDIEAMIIPEATCAAMIKVDWKHALELSGGNEEWIERLERLLPKIFMASEWLDSKTSIKEQLTNTKSNYTLTYHDPCHAKKVLGVHKEPRNLLAKNFDIVEMSDCSRCCGFGGISMQSSNYPLALKAGIPKAKDIQASNAHIVSAECGACRMQITNSLDYIGAQTRFIHPLELVAEQLRE